MRRSQLVRALECVHLALQRLLACIAALVVFYYEMTGSQQTRNLLLGIQTDSSPSNAYSSPQIVPFLVSMLQDPDKINQTLTELAPPDNSHFVAYLEINSTTSELGLQASACNNPNDADHLYDISFVG
ncbi:hypothetical protein AeNC1_016488, partial [Aphanomyces euteiches]